MKPGLGPSGCLFVLITSPRAFASAFNLSFFSFLSRKSSAHLEGRTCSTRTCILFLIILLPTWQRAYTHYVTNVHQSVKSCPVTAVYYYNYGQKGHNALSKHGWEFKTCKLFYIINNQYIHLIIVKRIHMDQLKLLRTHSDLGKPGSGNWVYIAYESLMCLDNNTMLKTTAV